MSQGRIERASYTNVSRGIKGVMTQERFGELRGMLEQKPSVAGFENLIYFIDFHSRREGHERVEREWLPYALSRLEQSWPDATRECPKELLEHYESGEALWCPMIRSLNFEGERLAKKRANRILESSHMGKVTHLCVRSSHINWEQLNALAERAPFGQLEFVDFRMVSKLKKSDEEHLIAFFSASMFKGVRSVSFREWRTLTVRGYDLFMKHFPLEGIRSLNLDGGKSVISPRQFERLLDTGRLYQLEELSFDNEGDLGMSTGMLSVLAKHEQLSSLRKLTVSGCHAKDMEAFVNARHFAELEELHLSSIHQAYDEVVSLLTLKSLPSLRHLTLHFTDVGLASGWREQQQEMLDQIASSGGFEQLESLSFCFEHGLPDPTKLFKEAGERFGGLVRFGWGCRDDDTTSTQRGKYIALVTQALSQVPLVRLKALRLDFSWRKVTWHAGALRRLGEASWFEQLDALSLTGSGSAELFDLLSASNAPMLRVLETGLDLFAGERLNTFLTHVDRSRLEVVSAPQEPEDFLRLVEVMSEEPSSWQVRRLLASPSLLDDVLSHLIEELEGNGPLDLNPLRAEHIKACGLWVSLDCLASDVWWSGS